MLGPVDRKSRGRPRGRSRRYEADEALLEAMADAIHQGTAANPTQAARVVGKTSDADIVRLRRQFMTRKATLLADAEKRRRPTPARTIDRSGHLGGDRATAYLEEISRHVSPLLSAFEREMEKIRPVYEGIMDQIPRHASDFMRIQQEIDRHVNVALGAFEPNFASAPRESYVEAYLRKEQERERRLLGAFAPRNPWDRL